MTAEFKMSNVLQIDEESVFHIFLGPTSYKD